MSENGKILVIGGGISGISAAADAAELGCEVVLVEKDPYLGGRVVRMNQYFPKLCPPTCGMEINTRRVRQNPRITVHTLAVKRASAFAKANMGAFPGNEQTVQMLVMAIETVRLIARR